MFDKTNRIKGYKYKILIFDGLLLNESKVINIRLSGKNILNCTGYMDMTYFSVFLKSIKDRK